MSKFADIEIDPGIVRRAAAGDARAHEIIYRAFSTPVYSICLRFTKQPAHAEDLTQETFIEIMRSIAKFRGEAALGSWIRRIAVTKALMFLRSAWTKRGQSLADDWNDMTEGDALSHGVSRHPDDALDLDAALDSLPDVSRAVVWLHDVAARRGRVHAQGDCRADGQDGEFFEIAAVAGLPAPAADARSERGRQAARRRGRQLLNHESGVTTI
ncbi:MAG: sigma-70 family RNA polymerase sigma factor [Woeseiaceae bacterium]